ncbi:MAG TPA: peptide-methionine (R)-S-oxide reductase [Flavobacteriaceae bacterium]|jgi:peptide-methionine (R)-S-oxide reductase|nr:peptide-methionine (R)-S-oxide reductase [Flavobacteriaceae bacterium]HBS13286.1 peptide-methionine (R)-S-oxide reductase [Flavobacteriaceae bacterium]
MKQLLAFFTLTLILSCTSNAQKTNTKNKMIKKTVKIIKTDTEWKLALSDQEYYVLREKGTDRASNDGYTQHFEKGTYICRACNAQLFESNSKFESHCGWPSFDDAIKGTIDFTKDTTAGMIRTEITCTKCDSHLGHIFDDGPKETTGKRYCVNTSSIKFVKTE